MAHFVGGETELAKLKELTRLRTASLVVIKGRRRVGKSRLASEFAKQPLAERTATGKWVVILGEINWLGAKDPTFLGKLKSAWDRPGTHVPARRELPVQFL